MTEHLQLQQTTVLEIREVFKESGKFANKETLADFCVVAELGYLTTDLKDASSTGNLVDNNLAYFKSLGYETLHTFVERLISYVYSSKDILNESIKNKADRARHVLELIELDGSQTPNHTAVLELPFVSFVMNQNQAQDLFTEKVAPICPRIEIGETEPFRTIEFLRLLIQDDPNITSRYSASDRDDWRPYPSSPPLKQLIDRICHLTRIEAGPKSVTPMYLSCYIENLTQFRMGCEADLDQGAICVVDFISLLHPEIFEVFNTVRWPKEVSIITLLPESVFKTRLRDFIDKYIETNIRWYFLDYSLNMDLHREFQINNQISFDRQLRYQINETLYARINSRQKNSRDLIKHVMGTNYSSSGVVMPVR